MSVIDEITKSLHPKVAFAAREDKLNVDLSFRMDNLNELRAKVNWFRRGNVKRYVTCIHFGLRRSMTIREITDDSNHYGRLPTKLASAVEIMLR